jgi:hypothetical protein
MHSVQYALNIFHNTSIQHSLLISKNVLDAKSAFDKVVREYAIRNVYLAGSTGQGLLYITSRLENRKTVVEWDKVLMGPIEDKLGVEQGGVYSDRIYKLCINIQLNAAHNSGLGLILAPQSSLILVWQMKLLCCLTPSTSLLVSST